MRTRFAARVLYHAGCPDGFASAWVFNRMFGTPGDQMEEMKFIPVAYGKPPPYAELHGDSSPIYIVDFSYPKIAIQELRVMAPVTVIDHHKTAEAELGGLDGALDSGHGQVVFDMTKSSCVLCWEYLTKAPVPRMLEYIQDRDLWKFELPFSKEINAYIGAEPFYFDNWDKMFRDMESDSSFQVVKEDGTAMLRVMDAHWEKSVKMIRYFPFMGRDNVPFVNCALAGTSEVLHLAIKKTDTHLAVAYCDRADGKRQWGIRGDGTVDVSEIAKANGGGGHHNSAGWTTNAPNIMDVFCHGGG